MLTVFILTCADAAVLQVLVVMYPTPEDAQQARNSMAAALSLQAENDGECLEVSCVEGRRCTLALASMLPVACST